jgi:hypothetical protein
LLKTERQASVASTFAGTSSFPDCCTTATDLHGRIVHEYAVPTAGSQPWGIVAGNDGALWFTEWSGNKIGRVTTQGTFSEFPLPTPDAQPQGLASGARRLALVRRNRCRSNRPHCIDRRLAYANFASRRMKKA